MIALARVSRESSVVTRLIESARQKPLDVDLSEPSSSSSSGRREITKTVKIVMKRARSLPVAAALAMVAAAFLGGVLLGDRRETHEVTPVVIPMPAAASLEAPPPPTPAAAVAPSATSPNTGFDLRVNPAGAEVVLDGRAIGVAPLRVRNLTAGEHVIELAADGYFARRLAISLEPDEPRALDINLDRLEPEPPAASPERRERGAEPPSRPRAKGTLKIGSKPPCQVLINGREVGTTPEMIELGAGRHTVSLVNQTYAIRERIRVTIKPGETVRVLRDYSDHLESSGD